MSTPAVADVVAFHRRISGVGHQKWRGRTTPIGGLPGEAASFRQPPRNFPADASKLGGVMAHEAILTHFQATQLLAGRHRGFTLGKYKILEKIGSGGMGTVYLAEHKFMKRRVALKVLPAKESRDD